MVEEKIILDPAKAIATSRATARYFVAQPPNKQLPRQQVALQHFRQINNQTTIQTAYDASKQLERRLQHSKTSRRNRR